MSNQHTSERHEVIVIGAGQIGLAAGYHLAQRRIEHIILEGADRVGDSWRARYDSLRLYSPARYDSLPGMPFPGDRNAFPTGHQMADYLEAYATRWELPVRTSARVHRLAAADGGGYEVLGDSVRYQASSVIVATGVFQRPRVPEFASELDPAIVQLHSAHYRNPGQLPEGPALVVGVSHSGADIAVELAASRRTYLSGRSHGQLPVAIDSRVGVLLWPLARFAFSKLITLQTPIGRRAAPHVRAGGGPLLRYRRKDLLDAGVEWSEARTTGTTDGKPTLDDGTVLDVASVVWCTGYRPDYSWIDLPVLDDAGWPRQQRGVVHSAPGLYMLGMPFLNGFASMLVLGAGADTGYIVDHLRDAAARMEAPIPATVSP
jgi:putative flavoprotein involved in K+ transport